MALVDDNFNLVDASNSWLDYFGLDLFHAVGQSIFKLFPNDDHTTWQMGLKRCLTGKTERGLQQKLTENGHEKWFEWVNSPWYDEDENIIGIIIQIIDVTERVAHEIKFEKLENLLKDQSEISKVGTWEYNLTTQELTWSAMTKKIHEVGMDYLPNVETAINFYKQGHDRNAIAMLVHNGIEHGKAWRKKAQIITAKGNEKWVFAAGKPLFKDGKVTQLIGIFQDITEQVKAEVQTKENEQLLHSLIDNLPLNVFVKDKSSKKTLVNKSECNYLGVSKEALIGKSDYDLYDKKYADISRAEDLQVMRTLRPIIGKETTGVKKNGVVTSFLTSKIPLLTHDGQAKGIVGISMDITAIKQKEAQLKDLINVTAVQNKKLINFAHIVSHNLRSHTANFSMLLDLLIKEDVEEERTKIQAMLLSSSDNLMETLQNLNEVIDIGTNTKLEKSTLLLNQQICGIEQNLASFLKKHKAEIINLIPKDCQVKAVDAYLENSILNLITNAVKYKHPERAPKITLSVEKQDAYVVLNVKDNGIGIDLAKNGSKLFGMYKTFHDNADARGIGLYITKNQIEAMGGKIEVCSEVGVGSTFKVFFFR